MPWDVASWREVLTLRVSGLDFWAVSFSADGAIVDVRDHRGLQFWRAPSWEEIAAAEKRGANAR